jgi:uncharacterized protein YbjQ (UPF0145 family)
MENCLNCGAAFKEVIFGSSVFPSNKKEVKLINEYEGNKKEGYCSKCSPSLLKTAQSKKQAEENEIEEYLRVHIAEILIMTIPPPETWDYEIVDMISAQSVTGTGVMSEWSSSFNDLFGSRSNTLSSKLRGGEDFCKAQLRIQCIELGCHAIVGSDIDYSEMGSLRGMMMVCIAGTAIRIKNPSVLGDSRGEVIQNLVDKQKRLSFLKKLSN